ncbi:hypothetical protein C5167_034396, partial [Papaver somniferum]
MSNFGGSERMNRGNEGRFQAHNLHPNLNCKWTLHRGHSADSRFFLDPRHQNTSTGHNGDPRFLVEARVEPAQHAFCNRVSLIMDHVDWSRYEKLSQLSRGVGPPQHKCENLDDNRDINFRSSWKEVYKFYQIVVDNNPRASVLLQVCGFGSVFEFKFKYA